MGSRAGDFSSDEESAPVSKASSTPSWHGWGKVREVLNRSAVALAKSQILLASDALPAGPAPPPTPSPQKRMSMRELSAQFKMFEKKRAEPEGGFCSLGGECTSCGS